MISETESVRKISRLGQLCEIGKHLKGYELIWAALICYLSALSVRAGAAVQVDALLSNGCSMVEGCKLIWAAILCDAVCILSMQGSGTRHAGHNDSAGQNRWRSMSFVAETAINSGKEKNGDACKGRSDAPPQNPMQFQSVEDEEVVTPGFMRSLSGSERHRAGLNIEVFLGKAQDDGGNVLGQRLSGEDISESQPNKENCAQSERLVAAPFIMEKEKNRGVNYKSVSSLPKQTVTKKGKAKGTLNFQGKKKGSLPFGDGSSLNLKKGAVFRSAVAAISLSMASKTGSGRLLLNEAEASLQLGHVLGLKCKGDEEEVISKLMELEAKDQETLVIFFGWVEDATGGTSLCLFLAFRLICWAVLLNSVAHMCFSGQDLMFIGSGMGLKLALDWVLMTDLLLKLCLEACYEAATLIQPAGVLDLGWAEFGRDIILERLKGSSGLVKPFIAMSLCVAASVEKSGVFTSEQWKSVARTTKLSP
ncbi:hypothetical protein LOK49_LG06G00683 [Camellia lanceoleosa]|uniref:Uncharacterized protein n=1 Tax=Camellia lanceoleosa TaxID=1840588 RepID=A0ACC0HCT9_9ERIC|nr:hypothetical protein LOK49_LG06G00683 [Camellia lanceoleosa]